MPLLTFRLEDGEEHRFDAGLDVSLAELLEMRGFPLNTRCGRRGLCRGCEVELLEGSLRCGAETVRAPAAVRSCRARAIEPATVLIPSRSRMEHRPQVGDTFRIDVPYAHQPLFRPDGEGRDTAFAADLGTTTVVVLLVDLVTGEVLARAGGFNAQIRFGDNVLTRIDAAREPGARVEMQRVVVRETLEPLLARACARAGRGVERLAGGVIAGNTTMLHLLAGEDPSSLGVAPFTPRFLDARELSGSAIGLALGGALAPEFPLRFLPGLSGYVGADLVAGIAATGMRYSERPALLVDIGTNGELVLQSGGRLFACATAAGPAFEGAGLRSGSRARDGAIGALDLRFDPFAIEGEVIGGGEVARAGGICGSAYIDFLARGRACGLLGDSGRVEAGAWARIPERYRHEEEGEKVLLLGPGGARIGEVDVAQLLQAKAAIAAGIGVLLRKAGIAPGEVGRLYLAGGFGMHLDVGHAIACGLLPGFREEQVEVVGNAALAGCLLALLDRSLLAEMEEIRAGAEIVELNLTEGFEEDYIDHLLLP